MFKKIKAIRNVLQPLFRSLKLIVKSAPNELRYVVILNIIFGAGPASLLYIGKKVIDEIVVISGSISPLKSLLASPVLLWCIAAFLIINVLLDSVETILGFYSSSLRDRLQGSVKSLIHRKVAEFEDIELFENPKYLNTLQLAQQSIPKLTQLTYIVLNTLTGVFVFIPVLFLASLIAWWVPLLIFLTAIPSIWVQLRYEDKAWSVEEAQASTVRKMKINERVLTAPEYAKEVRQFSLQSFTLKRWNHLYWSAYEEMRQVRRKGTVAVFSWSFFSGIGSGVPYLFVIYMAVSGVYTVGDIAMYAGLVFEVRRSLFVLIGNAANLQGIARASNAVFQLLDLKSTLEKQTKLCASKASTNAADWEGIVIDQISFSYPGTKTATLENVSLNIKQGEMVVIVGENGAGKTTLSKLLCRLYDPQQGSIKLNGQDLRSFELLNLRQKITVVNQDFAQYPASLRENIGFGNIATMDDDQKIMEVVNRTGLEKVVAQQLRNNIDAPLSKQFEAGVELSGGQWQRVAIARALFRNEESDVLILDEPTSALDPQTEHEVYELFREMADGKIAVIISHRLALARIADKIVVMKAGKIEDVGHHDELMERCEEYQTMFNRQASSYL